MSTHNYKRSFLMAMVLGVLGVASGCDRLTNIIRSAESANSSRMTEAAGAGNNDADPARAGSYSSVAEARHFDVYNDTRTLFGRTEDFIPSHAYEATTGNMPAIGLFGAAFTGASSANCFMAPEKVED